MKYLNFKIIFLQAIVRRITLIRINISFVKYRNVEFLTFTINQQL